MKYVNERFFRFSVKADFSVKKLPNLAFESSFKRFDTTKEEKKKKYPLEVTIDYNSR